MLGKCQGVELLTSKLMKNIPYGKNVAREMILKFPFLFTSKVWVPILQIIEDETFGYSSTYWTNDDLLNENSALSENVNAKYAGFLNQPFSMIRMCSGGPDTNCVIHTFDVEWSNAKELFSAGHIRDTSLNQPGILKVFGPEEDSYSVSYASSNTK